MIIDFHTHIFPDFVAERAIASLEKSSGYKVKNSGRAVDLLKEMESSKVDYSVNMPILTNPTRFQSTLDHLLEEREKYPKIINFAAIHPLTENLQDCIKTIKKLGFKGIKLHPLFQNFAIDSIESERLIGLAAENDLIVTIHAGFDVSFPDSDFSVPKRLVKLYKDLSYKKLVYAHMGALSYWNEVLDDMCGMDIYFDTGYALTIMEDKLFTNIVKTHGADKVLFGTDSPWQNQKPYIERLMALELSKIDKEKILSLNAQKLLGMV